MKRISPIISAILIFLLAACGPSTEQQADITATAMTATAAAWTKTPTATNTQTPTQTKTIARTATSENEITPIQTKTIELIATPTKLPGLGVNISHIKNIYEQRGYTFSPSNDIHSFPAIIGRTQDDLFLLELAGIDDILFISSFGVSRQPIYDQNSDKMEDIIVNIYEFFLNILLYRGICWEVYEKIGLPWTLGINSSDDYHLSTTCGNILISFDSNKTHYIYTLESILAK